MATFVRVCESLAKQGFIFYNYRFSKTTKKDGKKIGIDKTLEDIQEEYPNIDIEKVIEETGVQIDYSIGAAKKSALSAAKGRGTTIITEEEKQKLVKLGVIIMERESQMSIFVRVCEALEKQGFDFRKFSFSTSIKMENGKRKNVYKTLENIQREYPEIDIERILIETGVDVKYSIGSSKTTATSAARGAATTTPITEEEKNKLIGMGVITLESKLVKAKQQRDEAKTRNNQAKRLEQEVSAELKKRGQTHEEE